MELCTDVSTLINRYNTALIMKDGIYTTLTSVPVFFELAMQTNGDGPALKLGYIIQAIPEEYEMPDFITTHHVIHRHTV